MKYKAFFLLLLLIPTLLCAFDRKASKTEKSKTEKVKPLKKDECEVLCKEATKEWNLALNIIKRLNNSKINEIEKYKDLLNNAITHCKAAIGHYDTILTSLAPCSDKKDL